MTSEPASPASLARRVRARLAPLLGRPLAVVLLVALGWRLAFLFWTGFAIESDEAVIGLMAKHVGEGRELPIWFYGQEYMGALEAYVVAPLVWLIGPSPVALKLSALLWALVAVGSFSLLARRTLGSRASALFAALYLAAPPLLLTLWSLKTRQVISTMALGHLLLLLAHRHVERPARRTALLAGAVAGLATWSNLLVFPYVAAAGLYLLSRRSLFRPLSALPLALAGFAAGAAPLWLYNLRHDGVTFRFLLDGKPSEPVANLTKLLERHLPMLLGIDPPWRPGEGLPPWGWALAAFFAACALGFLWIERRSLARFLLLSKKPTSGAELFLLVALAFVAAAAKTRFGGDDEPRYANVLYTFLAASAGLALGRLWDRGGAARALAATLGLLLGVVSVASIYRFDRRLPVQPLHHAWDGTLSPPDLSRTYALLEQKQVDALTVEYWLGYRMAFETGERIVTLPGRYEPYRQRFLEAKRPAWLARGSRRELHRLNEVERELRGLGVRCERLEVDGFQVLLPEDFGLPPGGWTATASSGDHPARALDRDPRTRWSSQTLQRPGQWLRIDFGAEHTLDGLALGSERGDEPHGLRLEVSTDGERWTTVHEAEVVATRWHARFAPVRARHLRLTQLGSSERRWWSVRDLLVFGR